MTHSEEKLHRETAKGAFGDLLARNRSRKITVGATVDELITQHLTERRFFEALALASSELERLGESYETHARVARIETILGLLDRAKRSWTSAMRFEKCVEAYVGIGSVLFQQGFPNEAIKAYEKALRIDPRNIDVLKSLSTAQMYVDNPQAARRFATIVLTQDPNCLDSRLCRARAEIALENFDRAKADVDLVLAQRYKEDEARLLEVDLLIHDEEYEAAIYIASQLCEAHPESGDCLSAFRRAFEAFDDSERRDDLSEFLEGLDHYRPLPEAYSRPSFTGYEDETVDIIVPVHNARRSVERCLASLESHRTSQLGRIILVNDNSNAKTTKWLKEVAGTSDQISLISTPRQSGFSRALALGISESQATSFVALNSDTIVSPGWLGKLQSALRSSDRVAMSGPLSNNASWQNYGQVLGGQGGFHSTRIPSAKCREDLSREIGARTDRTLIPMPLLHGFCVLVDRKTYDECNGIDENLFPEGYGEFQDLSIRMREYGHELLAVSDCVVFHERGASLNPQRRSALSLEGRKNLYSRYAALNYLCLEMASVLHPDLEQKRKDIRPILDAWSI